MGRIGSVTLIAFAGWTLACQLAMLTQRSLFVAILLAPLIILLLVSTWLRMRATAVGPTSAHVAFSKLGPRISEVSCAALVVLLLGFSWSAFWACSVALAGTLVWRSRHASPSDALPSVLLSRRSMAWIASMMVAAALLTLAMSRNDLDDAYYVASAAYTAGHPHAALLQTDPMFGQCSQLKGTSKNCAIAPENHLALVK
jgi:hypothetical protein